MSKYDRMIASNREISDKKIELAKKAINKLINDGEEFEKVVEQQAWIAYPRKKF